jgi:peptide/nickel transport system permease protein
VRLYFGKKLLTYSLTFIAAVTVDWAIPRLMPGSPIDDLLARIAPRCNNAEQCNAIRDYFYNVFGLHKPLWVQYLNFWKSLFRGDLGISVMSFPTPVSTLISNAIPYTLGLLIPAILLSFWAGNKVGALAARRKILDNTVLPISYTLTATPYQWLAMVLAWTFAVTWRVFPVAGGYDPLATPSWTFHFAGDLLYHWFLPFLSLFLVGFGGWAIGMRNLIIYELESDYAHYLEALGAPRKLVRKYAYRNALLPQITGLALAIGAVVGGALVTEIVFGYPGIGSLILRAIQNKDYFAIQGIFLFIIIGVLVANFIVDVLYVIIDPRTRIGMQGGKS